MMATAGPPGTSSFLPLLESLEDGSTGQSEQTDAYLTIASRLSGEEGRQFLPAVEKHFARLGAAILAHITSPHTELSQAALQALGFCVYHSHVVSAVPETLAAEILSALCSLVVKSTDKNTCTRALWVISKQSFPADIVSKKVPSILGTLDSVWSREDIQSVVMEHEALNVVIRMLEQVPAQMGDGAVQWVKLVVPLVVHSASKVRLRAAAAMEMGLPLLLEKQMEVAAVIEPMMSSKLIPELQKLFMSKNETNVLKLWPLFVKLLGKLLHRGGPFINSLLHLEELGFRSSSPTIKKIAFIAWKSLIDNFALNPDILCSAKRMKLLMQPLTSIHVRTEALLLTKVEVWWYLVVQLGPNLSSNFDQVSVPLLQSTIGFDSSSVPGTPSRSVTTNGAVTPTTPVTGFNSQANTSRMSLNSSVQAPASFPSIQLLGLEMLLHYFQGPEAVATATKNKLVLSLEPLTQPLLSGSSSFAKHAAVLTSNIRDAFISIGRDAPDSLLAVIWTSLVRFVSLTIESGSKKDRQGCEVLTLMLQALQSIITSEALPADKVLVLLEATVKGVPQRVLGSASYQVGKMDVLNGTPALFLILLLYNSSTLPACTQDQRFFCCLQTLVGCGLSGPTSPLAFAEAVLGAIGQHAGSVQNKEQLCRMWSTVVSPLTDTITQSNEVNQGDALEHNFSAVHAALMLPITHLVLRGTPLQQTAQRSMLSSWSKLYAVFARCSALVVTAEENICCEELCAKMAAAVDRETLMVPSTLNAVSSVLQVVVDCVDFSPYTPQFQQKLKSPHTPVHWMRKRNKALGNLSTFQSLLVQCLQVYLEDPDVSSEAAGSALLSTLSALFTNLVLANAVQEVLTATMQPLTLFYKRAASDPPTLGPQLLGKLEKLLGEILGCLQTRSTVPYDDELLALLSPLLCVLFPHKNKQLRTSVAQFWNATFANAVSLVYPDDIRPILSQVKQKTPILLPGFEAVVVPDELSAQYSSESSQLETNISGMPVSSVKKESLPLKDQSSTKTSKPVSTKLDFSSPKPPRREVLEEEASIDFVFIPPETKERVLTEHQKEVKRTKRVDIPAMYNNLDASLDTTVFSQYSQSQDDSLDKPATEQTDNVSTEAPDEVPQRNVENQEDAEVLTKETQDYASPQEPEKTTENQQQEEEMIPESADVSMEDDTRTEERTEDVDMQCKEGTSPDISASSDLVSGTPQKPSSRRQSFITLEKYAEGKPASPGSASSFTGPLVKTSNSQEQSKTSRSSSQTSTGSHSQSSQSTKAQTVNSQSSMNDLTESPRRPKDARMKAEPVKLTERLPSDSTEDEDVIPDTQTGAEAEDMKPSSQAEEPEAVLDDSQSPASQTSPDEPRRSGRQRVRPQLPGEDPEERDAKYTNSKRRRSGEESQSDSQKSSQTRPNTRSKLAAEENSGRERLRSSSQRNSNESSQTNSQGRSRKKIRLFSGFDDFLDKPERRRKSDHESSRTDQDVQSQGRRGRQGRASLGVNREGPPKEGPPKEVVTDMEESNVTRESVEQTETDNESQTDSQPVTPPQTDGQSQEFELVEKTEEEDEKPKEDSQIVASSPRVEEKSQESEPEALTTKERESQTVASSPTKDESQQRKSTTNELVDEELVKDQTPETTEDNLSQDDSQVITPSSSDGPTIRRSRRSKATQSDDKSEGLDSSRRQNRSGSQQTEGRTRRSKIHEQSKSSQSSTPESSQSLEVSESSQGRGRYARRRSSPALAAGVESSESESSEARENSLIPKKKGRKPRASLQSPLVFKSKNTTENSQEETDAPQQAETLSTEAKGLPDLEESTTTQDVELSPGTAEVQSQEEFKEVEMEAESRGSPGDGDVTSSQDPEIPESVGADVQTQEKSCDPCLLSVVDTVVDTVVPPGETPEELQVSGSSEQKDEEVVEAAEKQTEDPDVPEDGAAQSRHSENPVQCQDVTDGPEEEEEQEEQQGEEEESVSDQQTEAVTEEEEEQEEEESLSDQQAEAGTEEEQEEQEEVPPQESEADGETFTVESEDEHRTKPTEDEVFVSSAVCSESVGTAQFQDSPVKQKDLEAVTGPDVAQSPSGGRTRGTWSPSASPSTSILKKGQKRPLEVDTPSPLVKSRRVSFANPIQQQEVADDIDRRSPAIRTSSPRRSKVTGIPQPKHVTTPTKGLLILSPRNLHSPGYKSSKKCLISEMSQEPRPVSRDCIYPALVGCSTPVEAVLPQISSNMWSRGFGQLVRARNIKTVGDLSALTPSEIKTLPIRSPKISNVKKALRVYEQQRKGRGGDELKSFDETEMMTSELEETGAPQNPFEEDRTTGETLATELVDEPVSADVRPDHDVSGNRTPGGAAPRDGLMSEVEVLSCRMTPAELSRCSPQQLAELHERLGGLMKRVVVELQTRLCPAGDRR